ncbi:MAG: DEAD/DEAH box helicase [Halobacteriaceae archaeon]
MDEVLAWLQDRPYYEGQLCDDRTIPGTAPDYADVELSTRLESALADAGIDALYTHQAKAVSAVRDGEDVVLATQTASGKTLAYTVPAIERALDHGGRTLYIGPQNALVADQATTLSSIAANLGFDARVIVDTYTGRLPDADRRAVRDRQPTVLLTNPDMLHHGILPHGHRLWDWFFEGLETVVVDEVHAYRGVFGSHVALVLRRLQRLCDRFDAAPEFVCCSATIGNPRDHAANVTGRPADGFEVITESGAHAGPKRWLSWNPPVRHLDESRSSDHGRRRSSHVAAKRLFCDLVGRGYQTLVFTRSRQTAERYAAAAADDLRARDEDDLASSVTAYQAALPDDRRRDLEAGLRDGSVRGVWSTNALELGVDIGTLDAVILDGYPGTRMETFQRAGRAGRGEDPALVLMVGGEDQLDQYVLAHPSSLFEESPEDAVLDPENPEILPDHVVCAARENWVSPADESYFGASFPDVVGSLTETDRLERRETDHGLRWTPTDGETPHREMGLRSIDDREVVLRTEREGDRLGTLPMADAVRDAHPGAIYHHQGRTYEVVDLDLEYGIAELTPTWADYYTRVLTEKTITVEADRTERWPLPRDDVPVRLADLTVTEAVVGYERRDDTTGNTLGTVDLDLPEQSLTTTGLYWTIPTDLERTLTATDDLPGSIHAAEHAVISMLPLRVLCDRGDIGGLSTPVHPHTGRPTIFVYDGYPGGVGLTRAAYENVATLFEDTRSMLHACSCSGGCPGCVQSPQCGTANDPLSKAGAIALLDELCRPEDRPTVE